MQGGRQVHLNKSEGGGVGVRRDILSVQFNIRH